MTRGAQMRLAFLLLLLAPLAACDLNVSDPNATTDEDAFTTRSGLLASAVGLQRDYNAGAYDNLVLTTGITTRELAADNTFANLLDLDAGGSGLATNNQNVGGYFGAMYGVASFADRIITGAQETEEVEPALRSGLVALGQFYRAAALGALAIGFTDVALSGDEENRGVYSSRQAALAEAASLLADAENGLTATPPSGAFNAILPDGFDLLNSVRAYRARFELFAGNDAAALAAAGRVDPNATSVFVYTTDVPNPLFQAISPSLGQPSFAVRDNLGLRNAEAGDGRIAYFTEANADVSVNGYPIETATGFIASSATTSLPVYVPDEMQLIRAEVLARQGDTGGAVAAINAVRTDSADPFGLAANLPAYSGATSQSALLAEIYYNRSTELFLQGLRLEDQRRLGVGGPDPADAFSRSRNFYPFPQQERLANANTPGDPSI